MKKLIILLLSIFVFIGIDNVYAYTVSSDSCTSSNSCFLVCSYTNDFTLPNNGGYTSAVISLYYHDDGKWGVNYTTFSNSYSNSTKIGPYTFAGIFDKSIESLSNNTMANISKYKEDSFTCPVNAYLDTSKFNEICFDDASYSSNSFCGQMSDSSSQFGPANPSFTKAVKDFDVKDYIGTLYKDSIAMLSDNDILTKTQDENLVTVENNFNNKLKKLYSDANGKYPTFIQKILNDNNSMYQAIVRSKIEERANDLKEEITQDGGVCDKDSASYNAATCETYKENLTIDAEKVKEHIERSIDDLIEIDFNVEEFSDCQSLLGSPTLEPGKNPSPAYYLVKAFSVARYAAIILLIVMTILDFVSSVTSGDENTLKKTIGKTIKRLIACIFIFLLPTLISLFLTYMNDIAIDLCGIGGN